MKKIAALLIVAALAFAGCSGADEAGENIKREQEANTTSLDRQTKAQPVPSFDWSQERQTVIDVLAIRAQGATSTTMFYLNGVGLVFWCPSIGAPVPATTQLTASQQYVRLSDTSGRLPVDQMEPTGIYVGETSATWTVCLDDNGKKFGVMWEAPVASVVGSLSDLPAGQRIQPDEITFEFSEQE